MARYGNSDARRDFRSAASRSVDQAWAGLTPCEVDPVTEQTEHEQQVSEDLLELLTESVAQVSGRYLDPDCRAVRHPGHTCHDRDGEPLRRFGSCWVEARMQVLDQAFVIRAAEQVVEA